MAWRALEGAPQAPPSLRWRTAGFLCWGRCWGREVGHLEGRLRDRPALRSRVREPQYAIRWRSSGDCEWFTLEWTGLRDYWGKVRTSTP